MRWWRDGRVAESFWNVFERKNSKKKIMVLSLQESPCLHSLYVDVSQPRNVSNFQVWEHCLVIRAMALVTHVYMQYHAVVPLFLCTTLWQLRKLYQKNLIKFNFIAIFIINQYLDKFVKTNIFSSLIQER